MTHINEFPEYPGRFTLRNLARVEYNLGNYSASIDYADRAATTLGTAIQFGTNAYKGALAVYCLIRSLVITGDRQEAERQLKWLRDIDGRLDSVDVSILVSLAGLWIANAKQGHRDCLRLATRCDNQIPYMTNEHLALEARLVTAQGFILAKSPGKALEHIDYVYRQAVRNSYPARMCRAMVLGEYSKYRAGQEYSTNRLIDASNMAQGSSMSGARVEALWCASLTTSDREKAQQHRSEAEHLADLCGYATLRRSFPRA